MKLNTKIRRHSGRVTPNLINSQMKWAEIKEEALEPHDEWNEWVDYRDGFRDREYKKRKERDLKKK